MERAEVAALVDEVSCIQPGCADRDRLTTAVAAAARLQAWLDARHAQLAADLATLTAVPERELAAAARTSLREAGRVLERAGVIDAIAPLGDAWNEGAVTGAHIDAVAQALRRLEPAERPALVAGGDWLVEIASRSTPPELRKVLAREVRELQAGGGMDRLEQQRRACRVRTWTDHVTGMWHLAGEFDPETGLHLSGRLAATLDTLVANGLPELAPSDPIERQGFLRAHALVALTEGRGPGPGVPELTVVLDTRPPEGPVVDWGIDVELPLDVLHALFEGAGVSGVADVAGMVVHNGAVVHTPGRLDLARSCRLANHDQRRALGAIYPTCAIPGCETRYRLCKLHHVIWWEHGGSTDLDNLLPLCVHHHHAVHDGGWQLHLEADRRLTITYPGGSQQTTGPPRR